MLVVDIVLLGWFVNIGILILGTIYMTTMALRDDSFYEIDKLKNVIDNKKEPWLLLIPFSGIFVIGKILWNQYQYYKYNSGSYIDFLIWYTRKDKS